MLDALKGNCDLCIIPTGIHHHKNMTLQALAAGMDVLVEKPLAGNVADAGEIVDAARSSGRRVSVGFQDMYAWQTWQIKNRLTSGMFGRVLEIHVIGSWYRSQEYYTRTPWTGRRYCDGRAVFDSPLNNAFAHFLNLGLFFAARLPEDSARIKTVDGQLLRHYPIETFDTACVHLRTTDGVAIHCTVTHVDPVSSEPEVIIRAEQGEIVWRLERDVTFRSTGNAHVEHWPLDSVQYTREQMLRKFITNEVPLCPASLALRHVEAVENINRILPVSNGHVSKKLSWDGRRGVFQRLCMGK